MFYYSGRKNDEVVIGKLNELSTRYPTRGFETYYGKIRLSGLKWNRKRFLRIYRNMNLKMPRKRKRSIPTRLLAFELQVEYNKNHPYKSLNGQSPWLFTGQRLIDEMNY